MKLYSSMRTLPVTNNAKGQQREITLNFNRLNRTYFPIIALLWKKECPIFHAANIEASKFFVCFCRWWEIIPKDFPNASSMYMLLQLSYIFSFASES